MVARVFDITIPQREKLSDRMLRVLRQIFDLPLNGKIDEGIGAKEIQFEVRQNSLCFTGKLAKIIIRRGELDRFFPNVCLCDLKSAGVFVDGVNVPQEDASHQNAARVERMLSTKL